MASAPSGASTAAPGEPQRPGSPGGPSGGHHSAREALGGPKERPRRLARRHQGGTSGWFRLEPPSTLHRRGGVCRSENRIATANCRRGIAARGPRPARGPSCLFPVVEPSRAPLGCPAGVSRSPRAVLRTLTVEVVRHGRSRDRICAFRSPRLHRRGWAGEEESAHLQAIFRNWRACGCGVAGRGRRGRSRRNPRPGPNRDRALGAATGVRRGGHAPRRGVTPDPERSCGVCRRRRHAPASTGTGARCGVRSSHASIRPIGP
jgi:hypothetical protein